MYSIYRLANFVMMIQMVGEKSIVATKDRIRLTKTPVGRTVHFVDSPSPIRPILKKIKYKEKKKG